MLSFLPTGQALVMGEFQSRQAGMVTVVPWGPRRIDSKTPRVPQSEAAQVPYVNWHSAVGPPVPGYRVPTAWDCEMRMVRGAVHSAVGNQMLAQLPPPHSLWLGFHRNTAVELRMQTRQKAMNPTSLPGWPLRKTPGKTHRSLSLFT